MLFRSERSRPQNSPTEAIPWPRVPQERLVPPLWRPIAQPRAGDSFPSKGRARGNVYIHDLNLLIHEAELTAAFIAEAGTDSVFADYWDVAARWSEQSRYAFFQEQDARGLSVAVFEPEHGVLQWLRRHW